MYRGKTEGSLGCAPGEGRWNGQAHDRSTRARGQGPRPRVRHRDRFHSGCTECCLVPDMRLGSRLWRRLRGRGRDYSSSSYRRVRTP